MLGDLKASSREKDPSVLNLDSAERAGNMKSAGITKRLSTTPQGF
jgi:hypothetical protein